MAHLHRSGGTDGASPSEVPETNKTLLAVAGVLLAIPVVALLWVSSYARDSPRLWGFPFFFWYQFLWVFICAGCTYTAHRLVLAARAPRPGVGAHRGDEETGR
jgi:membrane protein implicated in regulation of membrane protease activity